MYDTHAHTHAHGHDEAKEEGEYNARIACHDDVR